MKDKNITIGKIILAIIAIGVMFVPVYAVETIESRAITHALTVEGLYVNGTTVDIIDFDNDTKEVVEDFYPVADANYTTTEDSVVYLASTGPASQDLLYRNRATYLGNGSYSFTYNVSEEAGTIQQRKIYIPLNINASDLVAADFYRITSTGDYTPGFVIFEGNNAYEIGSAVEVATDDYIMINTIQTRSIINGLTTDAQVFLWYNCYDDIDTPTWTIKVQQENYQGADILTWNDETLYIMAVILCDVLLVGAIVFASDPIDIFIDRKRK